MHAKQDQYNQTLTAQIINQISLQTTYLLLPCIPILWWQACVLRHFVDLDKERYS